MALQAPPTGSGDPVPSLAPAADARPRFLGSASGHFAALSAFAGPPIRRGTGSAAANCRWTIGAGARGSLHAVPTGRTTSPGVLAVLDDAMRDVASAERELSSRLEADIASIAGPDPRPCMSSAERLERLEAGLIGETDAERRLLAMLAYGRAERSRGSADAAQLAARALRGGHLLADGVRSPALQAAGLVLGLAGHTRAAEDLFGQIAQQARRMEAWAAFAAALAQRGVERYRRGALAQATDDLRTARDVARGQPWETMVDDGRAHLLRVNLEHGRIEAAEHELESWSAAGPLPETTFGNRILIERGRLRLAQGRFAEAASDFALVGTRLAGRDDSIMFEWRGPAAMANHQLGRRPEALELANADLALARGWGAPRQLGIALGTLGLIESGRDGIRRLGQAVEILEGSSARLEHARALVNLGALLRRTGEPAQARSKLVAGLELAERTGAAGLVGRANEEIAATGARRRRRTHLSGADALTPSEHRVARLAAEGLSNPDIARTLFVSRKTIEMHLGNVYRKLQINSRGQLNSALGLTADAR